jgi:D-3-phosphoglycerate dehydrogenase / 2-oxoglutarate reductase
MGRAGWDLLRERDDIEAIPFPAAITSDEFAALLQSTGNVHAVILGLTRFGERECGCAPRIEVVGRIGVGYDAIDVPALTRRRIPLMVVGTANSASVAEHALFLMLALAKRGAHLDRMVRSGGWTQRFLVLPVDLCGKTVLIVGFGRIGTRVAARCTAMEMTVLVYDPYVDPRSIAAAGCEPVSDLDAALPRADFVSIHCPKTTETIGLFGSDRFQRMKKTAYIINTARGGIICERALHRALVQEIIAGAGIDVFDREPPPPDSPLLELDTVVYSPHLAGVTREAVDRMARQAVQNVLSVLDGQPLRENVVNPEVLG